MSYLLPSKFLCPIFRSYVKTSFGTVFYISKLDSIEIREYLPISVDITPAGQSFAHMYSQILIPTAVLSTVSQLLSVN